MDDKKFEPELGHMMFGQDWQEHDASPMLDAALDAIRAELDRVMWNINQRVYDSPFGNTGNSFECPAFKIEAYSWNEDYDQPFNFKWKDVEINWYKYLGRDTSVNQVMSNDKIAEMLNECLEAIRKYEKENDPTYDIF